MPPCHAVGFHNISGSVPALSGHVCRSVLGQDIETQVATSVSGLAADSVKELSVTTDHLAFTQMWMSAVHRL